MLSRSDIAAMGVIAAVGSGVASATAATETGDEQPLESRSAPRTGAATSSEVVVRSKLRLLEAMLAPGGPASRLDAAHEEAVRRGAAVARQRHAAAVEALAAGRLSDADTELSMALRELGNALRQSGDPEQARRQARRRYAELVDRVKGFRDAYDRIVADKARTQEGLLDVAELDGAVALAAGLAGEGRHGDAVEILGRQSEKLETAITRLRERETLVHELRFETPEAEYVYERERNRSFELLIGIALREPGAEERIGPAAQRAVAANHQTRSSAQSIFDRGDAAGAVHVLEEGTAKLIRVLRQAGFPIP